MNKTINRVFSVALCPYFLLRPLFIVHEERWRRLSNPSRFLDREGSTVGDLFLSTPTRRDRLSLVGFRFCFVVFGGIFVHVWVNLRWSAHFFDARLILRLLGGISFRV